MHLKSFQDGVEFDPYTISKEEIKQFARDSQRSLADRFRRRYTIKTALNTTTQYTLLLMVGSLIATHTIYA